MRGEESDSHPADSDHKGHSNFGNETPPGSFVKQTVRYDLLDRFHSV